jgi:phosphoribosylaminoimidazolecarboxamide formyltransferase/IMP cyclohydrolase
VPVALLSVSDKNGLVDFARSLSELGWQLIASGGTAAALASAGLPVTDVAQVTGAPEMLGGRVKTLHPAIHAGILARPEAKDRQELVAHGLREIDMVVCNLYPFQETVAKPNVSLEEVVEQIDIGGVTLLRAAAKNFGRVSVICDPTDYESVVQTLRTDGTISISERQALARKAFAHTARYDAAITAYFTAEPDTGLPATIAPSLIKVQPMRYGENPHQAAALYATDEQIGPLGGTLLQGKALSYNNMLDLDAAWRAVRSFTTASVVIVKHLSPCGIASAGDLVGAWPAALASDPVSAFGGVIAVNREFEANLAAELGDLFVEAIAAPAFTDAARNILANRKNCRLLLIDPDDAGSPLEFRTVAGGVLVQQRDSGDPQDTAWRVVTARSPSVGEMTALQFAWRACQHVKSNAIVFASGTATVGIGGGLPSRVDAVRLAAAKAGEQAQGAVMASDAFFPFPDGIEAAAEAGVTAVVQPGGSVKDDQVIEMANLLGVAMVFTGVRHFRH